MPSNLDGRGFAQGQLYKVTPSAPWPAPVELRVGDRSEAGRCAARYTHHTAHSTPMDEHPLHARGLTFRLVQIKDGQSTAEQVHRLDLLTFSDTWARQTALPPTVAPVSTDELTPYTIG
ncbi:hypothetical protein [Streptomyces sp. NPDC091383]|uniref:hypothetical protein n=1 Tax=Streptomyces sp. NPDC091383 TaxID=3365996 RepID=UPI0037F194B2